MFNSRTIDSLLKFFFIQTAISLSLTEYIENLRENFSNNTISIKNLRKSFNETKNKISKLDQSLNLMQLIDMFITISGIMLQIYLFTIGSETEVSKTLSSTFIFSTFLTTCRLIINCLIHGSVFEGTEKLFSLLDEMNVSVDSMNENDFREALYFKTQANSPKLGFTIAGLVPFRKITLISVSIECQRIC